MRGPALDVPGLCLKVRHGHVARGILCVVVVVGGLAGGHRFGGGGGRGGGEGGREGGGGRELEVSVVMCDVASFVSIYLLCTGHP